MDHLHTLDNYFKEQREEHLRTIKRVSPDSEYQFII